LDGGSREKKPGVSMAQAEAGINAALSSAARGAAHKIKGWDEKKRQQFLSKKLVLASGAQGRVTLQRDSGPAADGRCCDGRAGIADRLHERGETCCWRRARRGQREFAIRTAMGATRGRMMRQLVIERFLCAIAGGALGLVLGSWLMGVLTQAVVAEGEFADWRWAGLEHYWFCGGSDVFLRASFRTDPCVARDANGCFAVH